MQRFQVDPKLTREFLRAVVKNDREYMKKLIAMLESRGGFIGSAPFPKLVPLRMIDTSIIGCDRIDIINNTDFFKFVDGVEKGLVLDGDYSWNYDMVFMPFEP